MKLIGLLSLLLVSLQSEAQNTASPLALMPHVEDYSLMSWAEGFPKHLPSAPWLRVVQTGTYAFVLDTETLHVPHFGKLAANGGYTDAVHDGNRRWESLPGAELALRLTLDGKTYRCTGGGKWSQFGGPRLIESGRFVQRGDVTDLLFAADDGAKANVVARFETVAWPDRLALILAARPGMQSLPAGEPCFGRVGGGFGLNGTNHFEVPHAPELEPERFTLELWAYVPTDCQVSPRAFPWLVCKNAHEQAQGNYGIVILNGHPQARMNIGGGRDNQFFVDSKKPLKTEQWNHLAMSYDGDTLRLYLNSEAAGERKIGRTRVPGRGGLSFGRRQDNSGDGYHFRGAVDEIRFYDQALTDEQLQAHFAHPEAPSATKPVREWSFDPKGKALPTCPSESWADASMELTFGPLKQAWSLPKGDAWASPIWHEVALAFDPVAMKAESPASNVTVTASQLPDGNTRPVTYESERGWHRIDLDGIEPIVPTGPNLTQNDAMERVKLVLGNPTDTEQIARLLFEKTSKGIRQKIGAPITGISAMLRDAKGQPTGIPVQLSKNWHNRPEGGVYGSQWFHGLSQVRLPARTTVELELTIAYGHWGGVAAASHAQLCLIGWGSNQLWDQSALGAWGESICYEPDQAQGECSILDVRPVMVNSMHNNTHWGWTHNVGGGDFFRFFDAAGERIPHSAMRTAYERHGLCLTEVTYAGRISPAIEHSETVSLIRSDDLTRGTYRLRLDVKQAVDFERFVLFQIGADTYSYTSERKLAVGDATGLIKEWPAQWGGDGYRMPPTECKGSMPWVSMHEGVPRRDKGEQGAWANRGFVIREWKARLGGKDAGPWFAEHGIKARGSDTSTMDVLPPPGLTRLEPGDFVEATIEHLIVPQSADDYYGPNEALRSALKSDGNTWRMISREALGNDRHVVMKAGNLHHVYPAITVGAANDTAEFTLTGGHAYVPITITGLSQPTDCQLQIDGHRLNQSIHGNDFWQTDFDAKTRTWSRTYNVPIADNKPHTVSFGRQ